MILGMDISTSMTGITILDSEGQMVLCDVWDFRKDKNFFQKVAKAKSHLEGIKKDQGIEKIFI